MDLPSSGGRGRRKSLRRWNQREKKLGEKTGKMQKYKVMPWHGTAAQQLSSQVCPWIGLPLRMPRRNSEGEGKQHRCEEVRGAMGDILPLISRSPHLYT